MLAAQINNWAIHIHILVQSLGCDFVWQRQLLHLIQ